MVLTFKSALVNFAHLDRRAPIGRERCRKFANDIFHSFLSFCIYFCFLWSGKWLNRRFLRRIEELEKNYLLIPNLCTGILKNKNGVCSKEENIFVIDDFQWDSKFSYGFKGTHTWVGLQNVERTTFSHTNSVHNEYPDKQIALPQEFFLPTLLPFYPAAFGLHYWHENIVLSRFSKTAVDCKLIRPLSALKKRKFVSILEGHFFLAETDLKV